jgi:hypothetical protein
MLWKGKKLKMGKAYQFKIIVENSEPPVWRRIVVPAFINFGQLHKIIQNVFGWENDHMHDFSFPNIKVRIPGSAPFGDDSDYDKIRIAELIDRVKWFRYTYDFGDNWVHKIMVEKQIEDYDFDYPQVLKFKGENFEEDSGGVYANWKDDQEDYIEQGGKVLYLLEEVNALLKRNCCFEGERKAVIKNAEEIGQDGFKGLEIIMEPIVKKDKIYPNDLCPCGSGKKYKRCCEK